MAKLTNEDILNAVAGTALITATFFSPKLVNITSNSSFSSTTAPASAAATGAAAAAAADTPNFSSAS
jgi:hypothetical protein